MFVHFYFKTSIQRFQRISHSEEGIIDPKSVSIWVLNDASDGSDVEDGGGWGGGVMGGSCLTRSKGGNCLTRGMGGSRILGAAA